MRPIVSYAYFRSPTSIYEKEKGDAAKQFEQFLPMLVRGHYCVWRGYEMRIHHDEHVMTMPYWPAMRRLAEAGLVTLVPMGPADELCKSMLWRMLPVFVEPDRIVICRDVDSVPMPRDRMAVEEWLLSGAAVHCIHDASAHSGVMGGTTSVRSRRFRELVGAQTWKEFVDLAPEHFKWEKQGTDQHLLNRLLAKFAMETLVHELHHRVNDMGNVEVRTTVSARIYPVDMPTPVRDSGDLLCPMVGGCTEPKPCLDFYDAVDFPERDLIRSCEV